MMPWLMPMKIEALLALADVIDAAARTAKTKPQKSMARMVCSFSVMSLIEKPDITDRHSGYMDRNVGERTKPAAQAWLDNHLRVLNMNSLSRWAQTSRNTTPLRE